MAVGIAQADYFRVVIRDYSRLDFGDYAFSGR